MSQFGHLPALRWSLPTCVHKSAQTSTFSRCVETCCPRQQHRCVSSVRFKSRQSKYPNAKDANARVGSSGLRMTFSDEPEISAEGLNPYIRKVAPGLSVRLNEMAEQKMPNDARFSRADGHATRPNDGTRFNLRFAGQDSDVTQDVRFRSSREGEDEPRSPSSKEAGQGRFRSAVSTTAPESTLASRYSLRSRAPDGRDKSIPRRPGEPNSRGPSLDPRAETWNQPNGALGSTREEFDQAQRDSSARTRTRSSGRKDTDSSHTPGVPKIRFHRSGQPENLPEGRSDENLIAAAIRQAKGDEVEALSRRLKNISFEQTDPRLSQEQSATKNNRSDETEVWPPLWRKVDFSDKKDRWSAPPLPVPVPTANYLQAAQAEPVPASTPQKFLLILDLNGTLLFKGPKRKGQTRAITRRPYLDEFLEYCFKEHVVIIWSSAQQYTVNQTIDEILTPVQKDKLVFQFSRSHLNLTPEQFHGNPQVYKPLETVWKLRKATIRHPKKKNTQWSQKDTILIDDSYLKAAAQPYNHMEVPEYDPKNRSDGQGKEILAQVIDYLEKARQYEDASTYIYKHPFRAKYVSDKIDAVVRVMRSRQGGLNDNDLGRRNMFIGQR